MDLIYATCYLATLLLDPRKLYTTRNNYCENTTQILTEHGINLNL